MRKYICLLLLIVSALECFAQDPNFSQFFASPLTLNPAYTGKFDGNYRIAGNYRNQWPTINNAFTTATISYDAGILKNRIPEFDQFGVGVMAFADKSGNGALQNNFLALSAAYHKALDENGWKQLGFGFQTTYVSKLLDISKVQFEDQLTALGFTGVTNEIFDQSRISLSYFDVNAGALYNMSTDGVNNFYAGFSAYHVNRPKESFQGAEYVLNPRLTFHAGGMIPLANGNAFHFSALHSRQANASNTVMGGAYMLRASGDDTDPVNLYLGSWYRFGDALIPYIGLEFGEMRMGMTYDVNISSLQPASNSRGGAEFSLIYIRKYRDANARSLNCPKF